MFEQEDQMWRLIPAEDAEMTRGLAAADFTARLATLGFALLPETRQRWYGKK